MALAVFFLLHYHHQHSRLFPLSAFLRSGRQFLSSCVVHKDSQQLLLPLPPFSLAACTAPQAVKLQQSVYTLLQELLE